MALEVWTARINYLGSDRLDVTRKGADPQGVLFAPSWALVRARKPSLGGSISWELYVDRYVREMRKSYALNTLKWKELLQRDRVTLCCYCESPDFCHRRLLAEILGLLGSDYKGEVL
jgi:hypothetical protein